MTDKLFRLALILAGGVAGFQGASHLLKAFFEVDGPLSATVQYLAAGAIIGALAGAIVSSRLSLIFRRLIGRAVSVLQHTPTQDIVVGIIGLVAGMLIAILATSPLPRNLPVVGDYLPIILTLGTGYVGMVVAAKKRDDLLQLFRLGGRSERSERTGLSRGERIKAHRAASKILDTSVIIDGRIAEVVESGFLEGPLIVPGFVLQELQQIADSPDMLKRNRGRRGLDILGQMQKNGSARVQLVEKDFADMTEVDAKLVRLAKSLDGKVVTNDYNLNKVAELHGVPVLNLNELANAVKPVVLPGEVMTVRLIKDGKEAGQGVGYLDDGTMIVVDGGRPYIGSRIPVAVTSVLQTAAGRMIFAKPKAEEQPEPQQRLG